MRLGRFGKLLHWDDTSLGVGNISRFTVFELKWLGGIIVNIFNTMNQDRFHSHAFHSFSWMIRGHYYEDVIVDGSKVVTKRIERSRVIPKNYVHKITRSSRSAISITFEGPWESTWNEYFNDGRVKTYGWGRKVIYDSKYVKLEERQTSKYRGYLGLQNIQGFIRPDDRNVPSYGLAYELDQWIERNTHLPTGISVSREFKTALDHHAGFYVSRLGTLLGDFDLTVHDGSERVIVHG